MICLIGDPEINAAVCEREACLEIMKSQAARKNPQLLRTLEKRLHHVCDNMENASRALLAGELLQPVFAYKYSHACPGAMSTGSTAALRKQSMTLIWLIDIMEEVGAEVTPVRTYSVQTDTVVCS